MAHGWEINDAVVADLRAHGGRARGVLAGRPLLILRTTGARSGMERVNPLVYQQDEGRWFVFASAAGTDRHPDWYRNLIAHPDAVIEVDGREVPVTATTVEEPERTQRYDSLAARIPEFAGYAKNTTRVIPVIALVPQGN